MPFRHGVDPPSVSEPDPEQDQSAGAPQKPAQIAPAAVVVAVMEGLAWLAVVLMAAYGWLASEMGALGAKAHCIEEITRASEDWASRLKLIIAIGVAVRIPLAIWQGLGAAQREQREVQRPLGAGWSVMVFLAGLVTAALTLVALVGHYGEWPTFGGCY